MVGTKVTRNVEGFSLGKTVALETQTLMHEGPKSITRALKPITRLFSLAAKPSGKAI